MAQPAPVGQGRPIGQEDEVATWHEGGRQSLVGDLEGALGRHGGLSDRPKAREVDEVVGAQPRRPIWELGGYGLADDLARGHLHSVALTIVEADRLHMLIAGQRPGQADRGVLPAGKQHKGALIAIGVRHVLHMRAPAAQGKPAARASGAIQGE